MLWLFLIFIIVLAIVLLAVSQDLVCPGIGQREGCALIWLPAWTDPFLAPVLA